MIKKVRLDKLLVDRGLADSLPKAQAIIMAGLVFQGQERLDKPGRMIPVDLPLTVEKPLPFVGRGGLKLEEALDVFKIDAAGRICADIGSSTGGFTDCLLKRGAAKVFAVDVDIRQLDARLRADPRVATIEKNARFLEPGDFAERPSLVVMDVSFISVLKVMPALRKIMEEDAAIASPPKGARNDSSMGDIIPVSEFRAAQCQKIGIVSPVLLSEYLSDRNRDPGIVSPIPHHAQNREIGIVSPILISLIKPQFEAEKGQIGKKGLVRDPAVHRDVLTRIAGGAADIGLRLRGLISCSTRGQKGNQEFFGLWSFGGVPLSEASVASWIETAVRGVPQSFNPTLS